jgi:hypothetical protein
MHELPVAALLVLEDPTVALKRLQQIADLHGFALESFPDESRSYPTPAPVKAMLPCRQVRACEQTCKFRTSP